MDPLPTRSPTPTISLIWSGEDPVGGSGIAEYTVFHRLDDGPFTPAIGSTRDTAGTFRDARGGGVYDFYSVATDKVNNIENAPADPDATTTVAVQIPAAPNLGLPTSNTVPIVDLGEMNVDRIEHAVFEEANNLYVGANGRLVAQPFWQPLDQWRGTSTRALAAGTEYRFKTKARDASGETGFGLPTVVITGRTGDTNGDGAVNAADLEIVQSALGTAHGQPGFDPRADVTGDDKVTYRDLGVVRRHLDP